ncbi:MAG TPA: organomercurial lyase [Anaerolineales bacterium]
MSNNALLWQIRAFVYNHFADTIRPPSVEEAAQHLNIEIELAGTLYKELHNRHALFLEPETLNIRMANPFSGIPTDFKVHADGKSYYANCAWDMLGIPVALALRNDAVIEAICTESDDRVQLAVRDGQIQAQAAVPGGDIKSILTSDLKIHFPLPFARWYDDLLFT